MLVKMEEMVPGSTQAPHPEKDVPARKALLVLGMHRSGTSALAGTLSILGCDPPASEMAPTAGNERGYFESKVIHRLHTALLESAGSGWDDVLPVNPGWAESPRAEEFQDRMVQAVRAEFGGSHLFILKDPRVCRLMGFWRAVLEQAGCAPLVVHTHRNPLEVAASLQQRQGTPLPYGILLWLSHVLEAEHGSRGLPRHFTSYAHLMSDWQGLVDGLQQRLDVRLPRVSVSARQAVEQFLSADLWHVRRPAGAIAAHPKVSNWVGTTFDILERWATSGEDAKDWPELDRIRNEYVEMACVFADIIDCGRRSFVEIASQTEEIDRLKAEQTAVEATLVAAEVSGATLGDKVSALLHQTAQFRDLAAERKRQRDQAEKDRAAQATRLAEKLERQEQELASRATKIEEVEASLQDRFRELATVTRMLADREREIHAQHETLSAILNSTSWRISAPVRVALDLLRRRSPGPRKGGDS